MSELSSSSEVLFCQEDPTSWDADTWAPPPSPHLPPGRSISDLLKFELHYMPNPDYLRRFHDRTLDVTARQDAVSWILKVHAHYRFCPATACLSVNYLDRFLSSHSLPRGNGWPFQLLSVACLSIAAKMEETDVPPLLDLQLFEPQFVFDPRTVARMEVLVMANLQWRMRSVTPFDFVYCLAKLENFGARGVFSNRVFSRVSELILSTHRVIDFLGHRPSTIAAAALLCAAREVGDFTATVEPYPAIFPEIAPEEVRSCQQLMDEYMIDTCPSARLVKADSEPTPASPSGVLDAAACGSCETQTQQLKPESSQSQPSIKRLKHSGSPCIDTDGAR